MVTNVCNLLASAFLFPRSFLSVTHAHTYTDTHTDCIIGGTKPCNLTATGMCETHLLPELAADLELTFCDEDLWLIPGLFALIPCSFPS